MSKGRKLENWIDSYLRYTQRSEPPTLYKHWVAISVIASALQRKCWLMWDWYQYPNLYIVLVGPSGRCRKGSAMRPGRELLSRLGLSVAADATTKEALVRALNRSNGSFDIGDGVQHHNSLTIYSPELTVFLSRSDPQFLDYLTDWYDCREPWVYETKTQGIDEIQAVWVNLLGATTPELIQSALPRDAIGGGLTSRIIFVYEDRPSCVDPIPILTPEEVQLFNNLTEDLSDINLLCGQFRVTDKFLNLYVPWYEDLINNPPFARTFLANYSSRRQIHLLKLCMVFSAARGDSMEINTEDFGRAKALLEATEIKMPKTFGGVGRSDIASLVHMVQEFIEDKGGEATFEALMQTFHADADRQDMYRALGVLEATGRYKTSRRKDGVVIVTRIIANLQ